MWNWIKRIFRIEPDRPAVEFAAPELERAAKVRLSALRENELSVGSHLRSGLPVTTAPGQTSRTIGVGSGTTDRPRTVTSSAAPRAAELSEDFGLSLGVGAATGSSILGYAAGGSLTGALVGSSLHDSLNVEHSRDAGSCPAIPDSTSSSSDSTSWSSCDD